MYVLEPVCNICRWGVPYAALAGEMKRHGFEQGRIVVFDSELGGNLRRFFPEARIELRGKETYAPSPTAAGGKTAIVWSADRDPRVAAGGDPPGVADGNPQVAAAQVANAARIDIPWRGHMWKPDGYRISSWRLVLAD
jgi:hypothetical protein